MTRKATSATAAPANSATICVLPQPTSLPRSSARTSRKRPAVSAIWPGHVDGRRGGIARLLDLGARDPQAEDADRDVDQEDPLPVQAAGQRAADERADGEGGADGGAVGGQRPGALLHVGVGVGQQRERDGEHDRRADALHGARYIEEDDVGRGRAGRRGGGEDGEADREQAPAAEAVGQRARGQDDRGEREGVGVDDPLQSAEARVQVLGDARESGVDDGDVEHEHRRGGADHGERPALRRQERGRIHGPLNVPFALALGVGG